MGKKEKRAWKEFRRVRRTRLSPCNWSDCILYYENPLFILYILYWFYFFLVRLKVELISGERRDMFLSRG